MSALSTPRSTPHDLVVVAEQLVLTLSSLPDDLPERISTSQLRALLAIRAGGQLTVSELAQALNALPSSATRLCDRLVAAGLIERSPDRTNRRFHTLTLSRRGVLLLAELDTHRASAFMAVFEGMSQTEQRQLSRGLAAFAASRTNLLSEGTTDADGVNDDAVQSSQRSELTG